MRARIRDPGLHFRSYDGAPGPLFLRYGTASSFGLRHIQAEHKFEDARLAYVLNYGYQVSKNGTRQTWRKKYPGDRKTTYVIFDLTNNSVSCPGRQLGIVTQYKPS